MKKETKAAVVNEVRTRSLVIVDKEGNERARLTTSRKFRGGRSVELALMDEKGKERATLSVAPSGYSSLRFEYAEDAKASMNLDPRGLLVWYEDVCTIDCSATHEKAGAAERRFRMLYEDVMKRPFKRRVPRKDTKKARGWL